MAEVRRHQAGRSAKKGKGKARRKLPAKVRRRDPLGVLVTAATTGKHSLSDVVSDPRAVADQLEQESATEDQAAA